MKSAYFIMIMWQTGNVGSYNIQKLEENPKEGYETYNAAIDGMKRLKEGGHYRLNQQVGYGYTFTILEIFTPNQ